MGIHLTSPQTFAMLCSFALHCFATIPHSTSPHPTVLPSIFTCYKLISTTPGDNPLPPDCTLRDTSVIEPHCFYLLILAMPLAYQCEASLIAQLVLGPMRMSSHESSHVLCRRSCYCGARWWISDGEKIIGSWCQLCPTFAKRGATLFTSFWPHMLGL